MCIYIETPKRKAEKGGKEKREGGGGLPLRIIYTVYIYVACSNPLPCDGQLLLCLLE